MADYRDLDCLIFQNVDARQYYNELPKSIRERIKPYSGEINSLESLQEYAGKLK